MGFRRYSAIVLILLLAAGTSSSQNSSAPKFDKVLRGRALNILRDTINTIKKNYYDPTLHGMDLDEREKAAEQKIDEATSLEAAFGVIAWTVDGLGDSHTRFIPPMRPFRTDVGWKATVVGERCFITAVRPGSDAEAQGLKPGDELLGYDGFRVTRGSLQKLNYTFNVLSIRAAHDLIVASPGAQPRKMTVKVAYVKMPAMYSSWNDWVELLRKDELDEQANRPAWVETPDVFTFHFSSFFLSDSEIDDIFKKADKHKAMVIDLRDNGGGSEDVMTRMLGHLFDHPVKVGDSITRKGKEELVAKPTGHRFAGTLVVLVNSNSASAAEIFARVVQLEKRGIVIGDRSSGRVMESRYYEREEGLKTAAMYAVQVTGGNLIMSDGKSLENNPVIPDQVLIPEATDIAAGRDPVLARALEIAGGEATPEAAGKFFPYRWPAL